jgi:hypothetical protein
MLAAMWATHAVKLHAQQRGGQWAALQAHGSLLQGGLEGHPMFCVVLWDAIESRLTAASGSKHRMWLYVDDITIHCPVPELRQLITIVESAVNDDLQGELNRKKSAMHLPCRQQQ